MSRRSGWRLAMGLVAAGILVSVVGALMLVWMSRSRREGRRAEAFAYQPGAASGELPRLWSLPALSVTDHRGAWLSRDALRGRPFIADFVFTQCTSACPISTSRMVGLQRRIAHPDVRFVSFSVDPAHDDVAALTAYANRWNAAEPRWSLVPTGEGELPRIVDAFRVTAERTNDGDNPIIHSNVFFLVDGYFDVRGVYASEDMEALARLAKDVERLVATTEARLPPPPAAKTYTSLGCGGCHDDSRLAPPLVQMRDAHRMFEVGPPVTIDRDYLRRSILEPGHELVKGYPPSMPSYRSATHGGREHYFCSGSCRDAFRANPKKYSD